MQIFQFYNAYTLYYLTKDIVDCQRWQVYNYYMAFCSFVCIAGNSYSNNVPISCCT